MASKKNLGHKKRLTHRQTVALQRRLLTKEERGTGVQLRHSMAWRIRKYMIRNRVLRAEAVAKAAAAARRAQRQAEAEVK